MDRRARKQEQQLQDEQIMKALEDVADRLSVTVHYEEMRAFEFRIQDGGCRIKGEHRIFIDRKRPLKERISVLAHELQKFDLEGVYIPPLLREQVFIGGHGTETATSETAEGTPAQPAEDEAGPRLAKTAG